MPTVKEYQNKKGYYIRSNIDGRYVTLQLSPEAEGLLSDFGYRDGDQLSWQFLKPLCDSAHAYTNNSGTEIVTNELDSNVSLSIDKLSREKKQRLEEFLSQYMPEKSKTEARESQTNSDKDTSAFDEIDAGTRGIVEIWSPSDDEYEATLNRIARSDYTDGIRKSIAHHNTEHPMLIDRFQISSQGIPTYSFNTDGIAWTVHDFRIDNEAGTDAELFFDIQPGTSHSQSITIKTKTTEWHTSSAQFTNEQIKQFLIVAPDIVYYIQNLVSSPNPDPHDLVANPTANIPSEHESRVKSLKNIQSVKPDEYGRVIGVVLTLGDKGYGRVRGHTGHTFEFSNEDVEGDRVESDDLVTFEVKHHRGSIYADRISKEEIGLPSSELLRKWPEWHDQSLDWIRNNWTQNQSEQETVSDIIFLNGTDVEHDRRCIQVEIDSLAFYLITTTNTVNDIVDEAIRTLLKDTIDGSEYSPQAPVETEEVEISLPVNLLSMIDSLVGSSSVYETRSQLFNAALQQYLNATKTSELTVRVPHSYHEATERLAEERKISTSEFIRTALEDALGTELRRKQ